MDYLIMRTYPKDDNQQVWSINWLAYFILLLFFFSHKELLYLFPHIEHYLQITYSTYSTELTLMTIRYLIYFQKSIYTTYNTQYTKYLKH